MQNVESLWTAKQAAEFLGLAEKSLANDRTTGRLQLPYLKIGRAIRYDPAELRAWVTARRRVSTSDPGPCSR